mmetsp:Transcript_3455/g.6108  ORF Transcript_3455/g.6108 Transcript_3455/m.6108 type:complete len:250 (+) Transcript_3455:1458-2207(+)
MESAVQTIQRVYHGFVARKEVRIYRDELRNRQKLADDEMYMNLAALRIQALFRGHAERRRLSSELQELYATALPSVIDTLTQSVMAAQPRQPTLMVDESGSSGLEHIPPPALTIPTQQVGVSPGGHVFAMTPGGKRSVQLGTRFQFLCLRVMRHAIADQVARERAVVKISRAWRRHCAHKNIGRSDHAEAMERSASLIIQKAWRGHRGRAHAKGIQLNSAATAIQLAFLKHLRWKAASELKKLARNISK